MVWIAGIIVWTGCGGSSGGTSTPKAIPATNSSIFAIDCKRQRAYVPLDFVNGDVHGQVAVLDLSIDPDKGNPLIAILDIGLVALPQAAAVDTRSGTVMVLVDNGINTGAMLLINEDDLSMKTVPFPAGSRPNQLAGVIFNPTNNTALVSMIDADDCDNGLGGCTGLAFFDLKTQTFEPLTITLFGIDAFGLYPKSNLTVSTVDDISPQLLAPYVNPPHYENPLKTLCTFDEQNVESLDADPDGVGVDPTTNIWVFGNYESPLASVVNLNRSEFQGVGTDSGCDLQEGGTPPNSVNFDTGVGNIGMPGVAVNPVTHKALLTAVASNQIALLSLPKSRVKQMTESKVRTVPAELPNDPLGELFEAAEFPYGNVIDTCHNLAYVIDDPRDFMVQIDLKTLQQNPVAINTALPSGTCASLATPFRCDNGNGVRFYPLPTPENSAAALPTQLSASKEAHNREKAAKHRR
jgi:hypothetical protein